MGGDADVRSMEGRIQFYSGRDKCGWLAVEKMPLAEVWEDLAFLARSIYCGRKGGVCKLLCFAAWVLTHLHSLLEGRKRMSS